MIFLILYPQNELLMNSRLSLDERGAFRLWRCNYSRKNKGILWFVVNLFIVLIPAEQSGTIGLEWVVAEKRIELPSKIVLLCLQPLAELKILFVWLGATKTRKLQAVCGVVFWCGLIDFSGYDRRKYNYFMATIIMLSSTVLEQAPTRLSHPWLRT